MKKLTKVLIVLLSAALLVGALAMVVGASSGAVAAVGDKTYETFEDAVEDAAAGSTVKLLSDVTVDSGSVMISKHLTIDLNGNTINSYVNTLFIISDSVKFGIVGEGAINLNGMLFSSSSSYSPAVTVAGSEGTSGINISHNGESSMYIASHGNGTYNYKNLKVVTTSVGVESGSKDYAFFYSTPDSNSVKMNFDTVEFNAPNAVPMNPGMFIISIGGSDSKLTIKNSGLFTNASAIYLGLMVASDPATEVVRIEDSVISAVPKYSSAKNYALFMEQSGWKHTGMVGTANIVNSLVEAAARVIYSEYEKAEDISAIVNLCGSVARCVGENGSENAAILSRWVHVNADATSRISTLKPEAAYETFAKFTGQVGTRVDLYKATTTGEKGIMFPDGNRGTGNSEEYTWIYDPVGDSKYPYVMAKIDSNGYIIGYDGETPIYCGTAQPNYHVNYSFDALYVKPASDSENLYNLLVRANKNVGLNDAETFWSTENGMQWDIKAGSIYRVVTTDNSYVKYAVTADSAKATHTLGSDGTTVKFGTDPYFIVGGNMKYAKNMAHARDSADGEYKRVNVVVVDFDFGCDSELGYPQLGVDAQSRYNTTDSGSSRGFMDIKPDGTINFRNTAYDTKAGTTLKPIGEWNHLCVVFYTDPTVTVGGETDVGIAHFFLNGEYIGNTRAYGKGLDAHIMGVRFDISSDAEMKIGASIGIDNVSWKVYSNYLYGETDGNTSKDTAAKYMTAAPAEKYMLGAPYSVAGVEFDDINDAITHANALGVAANLNRDVTEPQNVTVDGILNSNGYDLGLSSDSNACQPKYDEEGNLLYYVFDSSYNGMELTYHWYIGEVGNLDQELNPDYFVSTVVGIGQTPYYDYTYPSAFDGVKLKTKYHSGWSETGEGSGELAPLSLSTYSAYKDTGVYLYPTFEESDDVWTYYIKETNTGKIIDAGTTNNEAVDAYVNLSDGETMVLTADMVLSKDVYFYNDSYTTTSGSSKYVNGVLIDNDYTDDEIAKMKETAQELSLDLNGHTVLSTYGGRVICVSNNTVFNVYSSVPGGAIYARYLSSGVVKGQRAVAIMHRSGNENVANGLSIFNAHLNVGVYTDPVTGEVYDGTNMQVISGVAVEGNTGDNSCSIYVEGAGVYSCVADSSGTVMTRYYDGTITVKNCIVAGPTRGSIIDMKTYTNCEVTPYVTFDNCLLINKGEVRDITSGNGDVANLRSLSFINCKANARLNPSTDDRSYFGYGCAAAYLAPNPDHGLVESGLVRAYYNVGMTFEGFVPEGTHYIEVINPLADSSETDGINDENIIYVVDYGYYDEFVASHPKVDPQYILELPILTQMYVRENETVTVTYNDENGAEYATQAYVKGGNVVARELNSDTKSFADIALADGTTVSLTTMDLVVSGWNLVNNVQADTVINPSYDATMKFDGLKASASLDTDFAINLYIPATYESYVTSILNGADTLSTVKVNVDGTDYLKATVYMASYEADEDVVFTLNVSESGYNGVATVTQSIASYAKAVKDDTASDAADIKLMNYMVAYAAAALDYFCGEESENLNALVEDVEDYAVGAALDTSALSAAFAGATVDLGKDLCCVLRVNDNFVGTVNVIGREFVINADSDREIVLNGLSISDFANDLAITATDADGNEVVNAAYNLSTYVQYHTANAAVSDSAEALDLIVAFYNYVMAAAEYAG